MRRIVVGICDDEKLFRNELKKLVSAALSRNEIDGIIIDFSDGTEVIQFREKLDILFLDEEMKELSGTEVKNRLAEKQYDTAIIYVTSHDEIMNRAFGRNVYSFIHKPVDYYTVEKKLMSVLEQLDDSNQIMYIGAESQYVRYYLAGGKDIVTKISLKDAIAKENNRHLIQCHRSFGINLKYVQKQQDNFSSLVMTDGKEIPVSRHERNTVKAAFIEYKDKKMKIMLGD